MDLQEKYRALQDILTSLGSVVVAYSGGVDSTFLLKAAVDTLGPDKVLACIGISPSLAQSQYRFAIENAGFIGARIQEVRIDELSDADYTANQADRCLHCKSHLYTILRQICTQNGFGMVVCGSNVDDKDDFRPGNRAAVALNVRSPLVEARLTKADIRQLSREMNLPTADVPASPCLASRIAYGLQITAERLEQVEKAEDLLRSLGLREFRVRHHDTLARIEVPIEVIHKITQEPVRSRIVDTLKSLGFTYVTVDLQGFRSGAMNETLSCEDRERLTP